MPDFEHRPDASSGGATAPNLWPRFVLLTDQKQKHLLVPNSGTVCMVGQGMLDFECRPTASLEGATAPNLWPLMFSK